MVHAIILLNVQSAQINSLAERLASLEGVSEVYSVAGKFDLAVMIRARDNEAVADLVTQKMLSQPGIIRSETLISFRVFSRYDLERMFSVGMDDTSAPGRP